MKVESIVLLSCVFFAGCASIPASMAAKKWIGRSLSEAVSTFGEPGQMKVQSDGRKTGTWHLERYMEEIKPIGNVMGRDAGGTPGASANRPTFG